MFWAIFITVISLCHLYVFWRSAALPFLRTPANRQGLLASGIILWLLFVSGLLYGHGHDSTLSYWLEMASMSWLGILFLLTSSLLLGELLSGGGWLFPRQTLRLRVVALAVGLLLSAIALYQGSRAPVVESFAVTLAKLPRELDGTVIVAMSDLHLGNLHREDWLAARIAQVREVHPDLVLLVGDIFEGHGQTRLAISSTLQELNAPLGVWGVAGNHEFYGGPQTIRALEDGGVKLLRNSWAQVTPGLVLAGVEEHSFNRRPEDGAGAISKAVAGRASGATILLSHKPWLAEEAAANGVQLMLSGHTHAGQIWPFNYLVERVFPLLAGRYTVAGLPVLVCRGTGTWGPHMRLWRPGEIMKVTLHSGE